VKFRRIFKQYAAWRISFRRLFSCGGLVFSSKRILEQHTLAKHTQEIASRVCGESWSSSLAFNAFTQACLDAQDEKDLLHALQNYGAVIEADIFCYQLLIENLRHLSMRSGHVFHSVPQPWERLYLEKEYFTDDPVMSACVKAREPFHWFACGNIISLSQRQLAYLDAMRDAGVVDGIAVPIHGGLGQAAFVAVGSTKGEMTLDIEERFELMCACHQLHARWMQLRGEDTEGPALSKRETEVLTLVAQGKTNASIAETLGVSDHTVDTLVRRSFAKLGVSDRISAALKAVGEGRVQI
jgi:DNA-binding CsgD family transcriptional regulator